MQEKIAYSVMKWAGLGEEKRERIERQKMHDFLESGEGAAAPFEDARSAPLKNEIDNCTKRVK